MIRLVKGAASKMEMSTGPKGVDTPNPIEFRTIRQDAYSPGRQAPVEPKDTPAAILHISPEASALNDLASSQEIEGERQIEEETVDSRKTAEAIMKQLAPELFEALRAAGEIEE